jgi:adenosine deaminase
MNIDAFVRAMPKTDTHCHIGGAMRPATLDELAAKHKVPLAKSGRELYAFEDFYGFIDALRLAAIVMRDREDFARLAYEAIEDGAKLGNLRHAEFMFNPQYYYPAGVAYRTMVDGFCDGIERGKRDFGVSALLIACIDRQIEPAAASQIMDDILAYRRDEVVGIGLDGPERAGPPQRFAEIYQRAKRAGLRRTCHCCEDNQTLEEAPPIHYAHCRDLLDCDRIDHGYNLLASEEMTRRALGEGLYFTAVSITSAKARTHKRRQSIKKMMDIGLNITINTDDPQMFKTDIGHTFAVLFEELGWGIAEARKLSLAGIEAAWLDEGEKRAMRADFERQLTALEAKPV